MKYSNIFYKKFSLNYATRKTNRNTETTVILKKKLEKGKVFLKKNFAYSLSEGVTLNVAWQEGQVTSASLLNGANIGLAQ